MLRYCGLQKVQVLLQLNITFLNLCMIDCMFAVVLNYNNAATLSEAIVPAETEIQSDHL